MANLRLRDALTRAGISAGSLADELGVDRKTVERWISQNRVPYGRHRSSIAALTRESETFLWPSAHSLNGDERSAGTEVVEVLPHRASIQIDQWLRLFESARAYIDVLVYAGLFLPEQLPETIDLLRRKADDGVRVRLLLGDPAGDAVIRRGREEGIGAAVAIKTRNALDLIGRSLGGTDGVQLRLHDTTLYTSVYRADDAMIANVHVLGLPAAQAPAISLRRLVAGGMFDTYATMYDRVWDGAVSANEGRSDGAARAL